MSESYRTRMRLAVVHTLVAVPMWSWVYAAKDFPVYGLFALAHAVLLGVALGVLFAERLTSEPNR